MMENKGESLACNACNTNDAFDAFAETVRTIKAKHGTKLMALQEAQVKFGYLDKDAMNIIADVFDTTTSEIYAIASFYAQFKFVKQGKYRIALCLGTACYVRGAAKIQQKLEEVLQMKMGDTSQDGKFTLGSARCVGCCGLAPVMLINEKVYPAVKPEQVPEIINEYKD
ncbi:MAG: NAD(P)H-dependent oxidoreductase subunit E [Mycoplasmataceae bacterium]|jgi:NADH:ubiquinone oxidoreductase subunit E|nr:NAD(P)H-dependent oxidoreductase subunit E [Mycoplasmataceae bacterium]